YPDVGGFTHALSEETRRRDAENGQIGVANLDSCVEGRRRAAKATLPVAVTDHGVWRGARAPFVLRSKGSPDVGRHAEDIEKSRAHQLQSHVFEKLPVDAGPLGARVRLHRGHAGKGTRSISQRLVFVERHMRPLAEP